MKNVALLLLLALACNRHPKSADVEAPGRQLSRAEMRNAHPRVKSTKKSFAQQANLTWTGVAGTKCLDGSSTGFGSLNQTGKTTSALLIYLDGGGACWDGDTCDCLPDVNGNCENPNSTIVVNSFGSAELNPTALPIFAEAAFSGPTSALNGFNQVYIPYCTGDLHAGNEVQTFSTSIDAGPSNLVTHFHGYSNITLDLVQIKLLFPNPNRIVVWGASSGGLGADCNINQIAATWPGTLMYEMNNAGAPLSSLYENNIAPQTQQDVWGIAHSGTPVTALTCPFAPQFTGGSQTYDPSIQIAANTAVLTAIRKAYTDDYSDATMNGFANLLGCTDAYLCSGACTREPGCTMRYDYNLFSRSPSYRGFFHTGDCHAEREQDGNAETSCDYDNMTQNGIRFNDWVRGWLQAPGFTAWGNVL